MFDRFSAHQQRVAAEEAQLRAMKQYAAYVASLSSAVRQEAEAGMVIEGKATEVRHDPARILQGAGS